LQRNPEDEVARVAILTDTSGYGQDFVADMPTQKQPLVVTYPMEISRLRSAYADDSEMSALSSSTSAAPRQGLQINLKESPRPTADSIPSFSPELSPVSQEAALLDILDIIARSQIEYVAIVAEDILDAIFLGRMLKQHCPDVRLFLFDSDLVWADIAQNNAFQGMMIVSSYPLFLANQAWTHSWDRSRALQVFPTTTAKESITLSARWLREINTSHRWPNRGRPGGIRKPRLTGRLCG
jgi:hypothetical protein